MFFRRLPNELALQRKYIGTSNAIRRFRKAIAYTEQQVLLTDEHVLASIAVQVSPHFHRHMYGLLIATSERLLFVTSSVHYGSFFDVYPYTTIERIAMRRGRQAEIILRFRRMEKSYIVSFVDERLSSFRHVVRQQMNDRKDE